MVLKTPRTPIVQTTTASTRTADAPRKRHHRPAAMPSRVPPTAAATEFSHEDRRDRCVREGAVHPLRRAQRRRADGVVEDEPRRGDERRDTSHQAERGRPGGDGGGRRLEQLTGPVEGPRQVVGGDHRGHPHRQGDDGQAERVAGDLVCLLVEGHGREDDAERRAHEEHRVSGEAPRLDAGERGERAPVAAARGEGGRHGKGVLRGGGHHATSAEVVASAEAGPVAPRSSR